MDPERQALLPGSGRESQQDTTSLPKDESLEEAERQAKLDETGRRLMKWTAWLLLAAVLIGTILGTVLVSIPLQNTAHPPEPRRAAAMAFLQDGRVGKSHFVIWSGRQHKPNTVYNDLYTLDAQAKRWRALYSIASTEDPPLAMPLPRWKAVSLVESSNENQTAGLLVYGGDPLDFGGSNRVYLSDLWRLSFEQDLPTAKWEQLNTSTGNLPEARRDSAGILATINGSSTMVVWGGRNRKNRLLPDVWKGTLGGASAPGVVWERVPDKQDLDDVQDLAEEDGGESEEESRGSWPFGRKKHKKPKKKEKKKRKRSQHPPPRKGHSAVYAERHNSTFMVVWGGRGKDQLLDDMWAFDLTKLQWEQWAVNSTFRPTRRHDFAAFAHSDSIYIYGGAGASHEQGDGVTVLGDIWKFSIINQTWESLKVEGDAPPPRRDFSSQLYSIQNGSSTEARFAVFGGSSKNRCYLNDFWEYSIPANRWAQISSAEAESSESCRFLEAE